VSKIIPTPALSGAEILFEARRWKKAIGDKDLAWWTKDSIIKHNGLLISFYHAYYTNTMPGKMRFCENISVDKDVLVVGDSGGFQVFKLNATIDPSLVFEWQTINCNIALSLDCPYEKANKIDEYIPKEKIEKAIEKSRANIEVIAKKLEKRSVKFYPVLHGRNLDETKMWWDRVIKPFLNVSDGIAVNNVGRYYESYLHQLAFVAREGIRNVHVLMLFGIGALGVYAFKNYFDLITFDSQGFNFSAAMGTYVLPFTLKRVEVGRKRVDKFELPCLCPVCKLAEEYKIDILNPNTITDYELLKLHNLYVMLQIYKMADYDLSSVDYLIPEGLRTAMSRWLDYCSTGEIRKASLREWI
jgi:hypothetical protein